MVSRRTSRVSGVLLGLVALAAIAYALRWRARPSPCPYTQRTLIDLPRPIITRSRLVDVLEPEAGEQILEVGPGTGYYTGAVARALEPGGTIHAVDVQPEMADHLRARTRAAGHRNVEAVVGDGQSLPYPDDSVDAAYLVLTLGEIPDQDRALDELARVIKPGGRLVVGESLPDPHFVTPGTLEARAERQGFVFDDRVGSSVGHFTRFSLPSSDQR